MARKAIRRKSKSIARKSPAKKTPSRKNARSPAKKATTKTTKSSPRTKAKAVRSVRTEVAAQPARAAPPQPGAFIWHELMTTDVAGARSFYKSLFGWKPREAEMMPGFMYTTFSHHGEPSAGVMEITPEHGDVKPMWHTYVHVRNVDATAAKAEELGGEVLVPPHDIPVGRWAMLRDPAGAVFCVYKPSRAAR